MDNKELADRMKDLSDLVGKIDKKVSSLSTQVKSVDDKITKQNGRVGKLEDKYERSLIQDTQLNTAFIEHSKQDDTRFASLETKVDKAVSIGEENTAYIQNLKGSFKVWGIFLLTLQSIFISLIVWYLTR